ncbi:Glutamate decarboxylase [Hibiscus syriacus]|uniref:glutamate decarboxylase n=1 Tax=Hibiscus syriacus TaxID=106335 RepID=A0A6A3A3A4_HIBSY|nr:Glutamate decarboxylase [Hibiscus syriacus]
MLAATIPTDEHVHSTFASRYTRSPVPRFHMPERSMPKEAAYQVIHDELMLDGNPRLNLASFVTTWMEPECDKLMMAAFNKNYVDMDEYPVTTELQNRCVNMIANLFHAPVGEEETTVGVGTVGSSEAIMLAGLAFKRSYSRIDTDRRVRGREGFERPTHEEKRGDRLEHPIHVDAASGGFIAPFLYSDLEWDFRLSLVKSINVSGHKYGLVYAGVGWIVWRNKEDLSDDLVFHINYLGSDQPTFTLNFSKGSSQIIAQYYQFL